MCELFAMSSLHPTTANFALDEFARHGGLTGPHRDGWGVAFYQEQDAYLTREPGAACQSANLHFIQTHNMTSSLVLAHIRQATQGAKLLRNTHPFARELGGRLHVFAHNGDLSQLVHHPKAPLGFYRPLGDTDSEYAFCFLLHWLEQLWFQNEPPSLQERLNVVQEFAHTLLPFGPANFLYADSEYLFIHGHKRTQPFSGDIQAPGLFTLNRTCLPHQHPSLPPTNHNIKGLELSFSKKLQRIQLVASIPLTRENWRPLKEGDILVLAQGEQVGYASAL